MRILFAALALTALTLPASASETDICFTLDPNAQPEAAVLACTAFIEAATGPSTAQAEAYANRGIALRELGDLDGSARDLEHSVTLVDHPTTLRMLAWTYRQMRRDAEAEAIYTDVLTRDDHWQGWLSRCVVRQDQEKYVEATGDCEEALHRAPDNIDALHFTARAYNFLDDGDNALPHAQKAADLAPDDPRHLTELAWALHLAGQTRDATDVATTGLTRFPGDRGLLHFLQTVQ